MGYIPVHHKRVDAQAIGPGASTDLAIWLLFQIAANQVLLPLLVATFLFSRSIARYPTVVNVCVTWIVTGIVSSLLFYTGQHVGPEPSKGLCIAQAALIAPVPPMTSVAALALVYNTWSTFRPHNIQAGQKGQTARLTTVLLLSAPYLTYLCFAAIGLNLALKHPDRVDRSRNFFYCSLDWSPYVIAKSLFPIVMCLLAVGLEVHLIITLSRSWAALRRAGLSAGIDLQLIVRVGIFTAYIILATAVTLCAFADAKSVVPDMFTASVGMAVFFFFATQADVLHVWYRVLLWPCTSRSRSAKSHKTLPSRSPTPTPSYESSLHKRADSEAGEKVRLAALHAYYKSRISDMNIVVEVIKRPEDAFIIGNMPRRAWGIDGDWGPHWKS